MHCLKSYLKHRSTLVFKDVKELLITYRRPHKPATSDTIARWITNTLQEAGIDTTVFTSHSCRASSTSKAKLRMPIKDIMKRAGWSQETTFIKLYDKFIINNNYEPDYTLNILSSFVE